MHHGEYRNHIVSQSVKNIKEEIIKPGFADVLVDGWSGEGEFDNSDYGSVEIC